MVFLTAVRENFHSVLKSVASLRCTLASSAKCDGNVPVGGGVCVKYPMRGTGPFFTPSVNAGISCMAGIHHTMQNAPFLIV